MRKKTAGVLLGAVVCAMLLSACGDNKAAEAANESEAVEKEGSGKTEEQEKEEEEEKKSEAAVETEAAEKEAQKVGVLLPDNEGQWADDRVILEEKLLEAGYEPLIFTANKDADEQNNQFAELIDEEVSAVIIAPEDAYSFSEMLTAADEKSIPVFSYDKLIMDSAFVKYYAAFDTRQAGKQVGENIVKLKDLKKAREDKVSYTIEFLMGSPDEVNELFFFNGIMEILQEYFDDGTLVCKSGKQSFDDTGVMRWSETAAKNKMNSILTEFYSEEGTPDIICTASDKYTYGIMELLEEREILPSGDKWPVITGVGSEAQAVKNVAEGELAFTMFMDREKLADSCVKMLKEYLTDGKADVKDYAQYDNGKKIIGTNTCEAELIDKDNYQILIDNGTYAAEEIEPELPTPTPEEVTPTPEQTEKVTPTPKAADKKEEA